LTSYHDSPEFMRDSVSDLADFWIALYDQVLHEVEVDVAHIWEDMCYKVGPLVSPSMFRHFTLPGYKRLTDFFRERGIRIVHVDCDGNVWGSSPSSLRGELRVCAASRSWPP
jgi:uroporphyrinogen decarboxylase